MLVLVLVFVYKNFPHITLTIYLIKKFASDVGETYFSQDGFIYLIDTVVSKYGGVNVFFMGIVVVNSKV